jgi:hypothetical protein
MVRRRARLHANEARLEATEQLKQLIATNLAPKHGSAVIVHAINLEHVLRDIQADGTNLHGDGSFPAGGLIDSTTLAHRDDVGLGAVLPIKGGERRRFAMPIPLRADFDAPCLRFYQWK